LLPSGSGWFFAEVLYKNGGLLDQRRIGRDPVERGEWRVGRRVGENHSRQAAEGGGVYVE
jgi:hypothetical protein